MLIKFIKLGLITTVMKVPITHTNRPRQKYNLPWQVDEAPFLSEGGVLGLLKWREAPRSSPSFVTLFERHVLVCHNPSQNNEIESQLPVQCAWWKRMKPRKGKKMDHILKHYHPHFERISYNQDQITFIFMAPLKLAITYVSFLTYHEKVI